MKKVFASAAIVLCFAATAVAQDKTKAEPKKDKKEAACKPGEKGKSCCTQPSKTAALRTAKPVAKTPASKS
ncbi:hypothetical protein MKQ70_27475 [Chitinophaga sedimenti]|uniref:hypothetical protein n=1 Tax=Chitinophaga sedimenti TaxID=2033606 RepID=UPI0020049FD2|nr:hypothetical protein [Chitinophaga sedimenti]MCK7558532.1 hypothetical protein [Chitinophaga sedimenti]